jgi:hypothetical protein
VRGGVARVGVGSHTAHPGHGHGLAENGLAAGAFGH